MGEGESMHSISQRFGMKVSALKKLNRKAKDRPGTRLRLR
ncbi:MAG: LysM domain-containing protein [Muribaculaceae bacterium]|nr:LysM domain-containing protein [Muribaculaceae bacterium]